MLRKGFTLIELLVVITIVAILAGAAIPYVQDYVEDGRYARAKQDLDEIRNALARFEIDRGVAYTDTSVATLVGPYLSKSIVDPWGGPYAISNANSEVSSYGPDGGVGGGDDVIESFRPPLALSKAYWEDTDQSGTVNDGDGLILKFTRPTDADWEDTGTAPAAGDLTLVGGGVLTTINVAAADWTNNNRQVKVVLTTIATPFTPGKDTVDISAGGAVKIVDGAGTSVKTGAAIPIKAR